MKTVEGGYLVFARDDAVHQVECEGRWNLSERSIVLGVVV